MTSGIYLIRNTVNGKGYVGRSKNIEQRWRCHKNAALKKMVSTPLYHAIRKYGFEVFEFSIVHVAQDDLRALEAEWMERLNTRKPHGYNIAGVDGGSTSESALKREAVIRARRDADPEFDREYRRKRSEASKSRPVNLEAIEKASSTFKMRFASDAEFAAKVRADRAKAGSAARRKTRHVVCDGVEYPSLTEAAKALGMAVGSLFHRIKSPKFNYFYADEVANCPSSLTQQEMRT